MKGTTHLVTAAAAALLISSAAFAQTVAPGASGGAATNVSPSGAGASGGAATTSPTPGTQMNPSTGGAAPRADGQGNGVQGNSAQGKAGADTRMGADGKTAPNAKNAAEGNGGANSKNAAGSGMNDNQKSARDNDQRSSGTVGSTSDSVSLTTQQKTEVRTKVLATVPRVTAVNFAINVGTVVPASVTLVAVPDTLITIHPQWRGYRYFVVGDDIIVVEPRSMKIVAVLSV